MGEEREQEKEKGRVRGECCGEVLRTLLYLARDRHRCAPARARISAGSGRWTTAKTASKKWAWTKAGWHAPRWPLLEKEEGKVEERGPKEAFLTQRRYFRDVGLYIFRRGKEKERGVEWNTGLGAVLAPPHVEMTKLDVDEKPPDHEFSTKPKKKLNSMGPGVLRASRRFAPHHYTGIAVLHGFSLPSRRDRKELSPGSQPISLPSSTLISNRPPFLSTNDTAPQQFSAFRANWEKVRPETWTSRAKQPKNRLHAYQSSCVRNVEGVVFVACRNVV